MKIRIVDEEGLGTALMMDGFTDREIDNARQVIRSQFGEVAKTLLLSVLEKNIPETIEVRMVQNTAAEREERESIRLASFDSERSLEGSWVFVVYEVTVKYVLEGKEPDLLRTTIIHEMMHAADLSMIRLSRSFLGELIEKINKVSGNIFEQTSMNAYEALYDFLNMLSHYRNEGIAILGECMLTKRKFATYSNGLDIFNRVFEVSLMWANTIANGETISTVFKKQRYDLAYRTAPVIILLVLDVRKSVDHGLVQRLLRGLGTGEYELTDDELSEVLTQSLSLSLSAYIQGLLEANRLDCHVAPIIPFLELCALLQNDYDEDSIEAFSNLMENPDLVTNSFIQSIKEIMGTLYKEEALDDFYRNFCQNPPDQRFFPHILEKVSVLHEITKMDGNSDRRMVAQWALTYLYDDIDVIHDKMSVIGFVDDMMVLDSALEILGVMQSENN